MKRELREEIAKEMEWQNKSGFQKVIGENAELLKAVGIAAALVLTGWSAVHLVRLNLQKKSGYLI